MIANYAPYYPVYNLAAPCYPVLLDTSCECWGASAGQLRDFERMQRRAIRHDLRDLWQAVNGREAHEAPRVRERREGAARTSEAVGGCWGHEHAEPVGHGRRDGSQGRVRHAEPKPLAESAEAPQSQSQSPSPAPRREQPNDGPSQKSPEAELKPSAASRGSLVGAERRSDRSRAPRLVGAGPRESVGERPSEVASSRPAEPVQKPAAPLPTESAASVGLEVASAKRAEGASGTRQNAGSGQGDSGMLPVGAGVQRAAAEGSDVAAGAGAQSATELEGAGATGVGNASSSSLESAVAQEAAAESAGAEPVAPAEPAGGPAEPVASAGPAGDPAESVASAGPAVASAALPLSGGSLNSAAEVVLANFELADTAAGVNGRDEKVGVADLRALAYENPGVSEELRRAARTLVENPALLNAADAATTGLLDGTVGRDDLETARGLGVVGEVPAEWSTGGAAAVIERHMGLVDVASGSGEKDGKFEFKDLEAIMASPEAPADLRGAAGFLVDKAAAWNELKSFKPDWLGHSDGFVGVPDLQAAQAAGSNS